MGVQREEDDNFDAFMDAYEEKEREILAERTNLYNEYQSIQDLDGKQEYIEIDTNRYKMHYFGWSIASVALVLMSIKLFK
jgi:hypothetical protein